MRIMTCNLWNVNVSVDSFTKTLDDHQPNVVAAQELDFDAAAVLAERYPFGVSRPGGVSGHALVADHPIDVKVTDLRFRPLLTTTVQIGDTSATLGSVHLANPVAINDLPHRRHQVRALVDAVKGPDPMVLVGDFNSSPAWPAYRMITRHFRDGAADWAARTGTRPRRTWNQRPGWPKALRIDHIMVRGLEVTDLRAVDVAGSDHRALIAEVAPRSVDDGAER